MINEGRVEQVGTPDELYDEPATQFVMGFLGPTTTLAGELVRPHDIELHTTDPGGGRPGRITRVQRVGFEVRVHVETGADDATLVQLTRSHVRALALHVDDPVWLTVPDRLPSTAADADASSVALGR